MMVIFTLGYEFFLTGLFAIGGGLATLPFLTQMCVNHPDWFSRQMLVNMVAVSESTPGPIGINMATYVGYTVAGIPGAIAATFSLVLPSLIIIMIIARVLQVYRKSPLVNSAFASLRPVVTGLIAAAAFALMKLVLTTGEDETFSFLNLGLLIGIFILTQIKPIKKVHPIAFILLGAALGIILKL